MDSRNRPGRPFWRALIGIPALLILLAALLFLDLRNQGMVWGLFWSLTGEETPLAQIRGMVEWAGNITRMQPRTAPLTPINHTHVNPYGVNTFLEQEVEEGKIREQLRLIREAGFHWLRQEFPWEDIEVDGRGQFTDSRFDYDGDGTKDTIDAWAKYDRLVDLVEEYGLQLQVRLSNPPQWSRADPDKGHLAPPDDFQDFVNYASAVAARYQGRIQHYQVWNEPNIFPEWGNQFVDPVAYTDLLCRSYDALKLVDPEIVVISGALAPTISLDGYFGYSDFIFLQNMYDSGAGECFDILSMQGYGLHSGPTDRRMRPTTVNYARNLYVRDLMVANGDAHKPIWISEAAWNPVGEPDVPPDISLYDDYGVVTLDQAARYMPLAYERAQREWPWIGVINYWFFTRPSDSERDQSWYYFRMVEPDYRPEKPTFTPLLVYDAMRDYIANETPLLYEGVHQAEDWAIRLSDDAEMVEADGAQFGKAAFTQSITFQAYGTNIRLRWRGDVILGVNINGAASAVGTQCLPLATLSDWHESCLKQSLSPQTYTVTIAPFPEQPFFFDSIMVMDRTVENLFPLVAGVVIAIFMTLAVIISALRERRR